MTLVRNISLCCLCLFLTVRIAFASTVIPAGITAALKNGDSKLLASFFNVNVELVILGKEDVYSKVQAELVLKDFFRRNRPYNFVVVREGGKDTSLFAIGQLITYQGNFKVYMLIRVINNKHLIHQLRIEYDNG